MEVWRKYSSGDLQQERETTRVTEGEKAFLQLETLTIDSGSAVNATTTNWRYQYDNHLNSACLELDANGDVISYEEYLPYGGSSYRSGSSEAEVSLKRYRYVGKERDEETGFYNYGARLYAS